MRRVALEMFGDDEWLGGEEDDVKSCLWGGVGMEADEEEVSIPMISFPLPTRKLLEKAEERNGGRKGKKVELKDVKTWLVKALWEGFAIECPVSVWKREGEAGKEKELLTARISLPLGVERYDLERFKDAILQLAEVRY